MSRIAKLVRNLLGFRQPTPAASPTTSASKPRIRDRTRFAEGDRVLVNGSSRLSQPLRRNTLSATSRESYAHNDIIGRPLSRLFINSSSGKRLQIEYPTLDEYISKSPRIVTPIYASYASSIVELLDLHVSASPSSDPPIEILDAGTGHGSLALHLAKAIAAANPSPPDLQFPDLSPMSSDPVDGSAYPRQQAELLRAWASFRDSRRIIIHTVESITKNRFHAEKIVRGFRQGLYWPHIDFHSAKVSDWIADQEQKRRGSHAHGDATRSEFLSCAILDLPNVQHEVPIVSRAMQHDGKLVVFVPSITQIGECQRVIENKGLQLELLKVIELGEGISTGRNWDLRFVVPRATQRAEKSSPAPSIDPTTEAVDDDAAAAESQAPEQDQDEPIDTGVQKVMICRPKVGERTFGGGFVGLWRKIGAYETSMPGDGQATAAIQPDTERGAEKNTTQNATREQSQSARESNPSTEIS